MNYVDGRRVLIKITMIVLLHTGFCVRRIVNFGHVSGFLSLSDHNASGNYALFDLVAALHYIRENIGAFGGDADEVTAMGHGYAAAILSLLLISPVAKGELDSLQRVRTARSVERCNS